MQAPVSVACWVTRAIHLRIQGGNRRTIWFHLMFFTRSLNRPGGLLRCRCYPPRPHKDMLGPTKWNPDVCLGHPRGTQHTRTKGLWGPIPHVLLGPSALNVCACVFGAPARHAGSARVPDTSFRNTCCGCVDGIPLTFRRDFPKGCTPLGSRWAIPP